MVYVDFFVGVVVWEVEVFVVGFCDYVVLECEVEVNVVLVLFWFDYLVGVCYWLLFGLVEEGFWCMVVVCVDVLVDSLLCLCVLVECSGLFLCLLLLVVYG